MRLVVVDPLSTIEILKVQSLEKKQHHAPCFSKGCVICGCLKIFEVLQIGSGTLTHRHLLQRHRLELKNTPALVSGFFWEQFKTKSLLVVVFVCFLIGVFNGF